MVTQFRSLGKVNVRSGAFSGLDGDGQIFKFESNNTTYAVHPSRDVLFSHKVSQLGPKWGKSVNASIVAR